MSYLTLDYDSGKVTRDVASEIGLRFYSQGLGRSWKKRRRRLRKKVKRIARKVVPKLAYVMPVLALTQKKLRKRWFRQAKALAPIVIPIAGALLAPFTGGASAVAAGIIMQGHKMYQQRKAIKAAEKEEKAALIAEEDVISKGIEAKVDALYRQNTEVFIKAGYPPKRWKGFSLDMKLAALDRINRATKQGATVEQTRPTNGAGRPPGLPRIPATQEVVPVDQRTASAGRMGDPATAKSIIAPGCPPGYAARLEGDIMPGYLTDDDPNPMSIHAAAGVGGYIVTKPTPKQRDRGHPRSWAAALGQADPFWYAPEVDFERGVAVRTSGSPTVMTAYHAGSSVWGRGLRKPGKTRPTERFGGTRPSRLRRSARVPF